MCGVEGPGLGCKCETDDELACFPSLLGCLDSCCAVITTCHADPTTRVVSMFYLAHIACCVTENAVSCLATRTTPAVRGGGAARNTRRASNTAHAQLRLWATAAHRQLFRIHVRCGGSSAAHYCVVPWRCVCARVDFAGTSTAAIIECAPEQNYRQGDGNVAPYQFVHRISTASA